MKESSVGPSRRPNEADTRRASKADQVYTEIKEAILSGELEPGAAIDKIASVSYTHLDVYKRQRQDKAFQAVRHARAKA